MMRLLIPVVIALLGLGGGVGAAVFLRPDAMPAGDVQAALSPCGEGGSEMAEDTATGHEADGAHNQAHSPGSRDSQYTALGDQFVVPVVNAGSVEALVILSLSVETAPGFGDEIVAHTPKLRDLFLRELLDHANLGGFQDTFTSNGTLDRLRVALREAGQNEMGHEFRDVLILDINRQEMS